MSGDDELKHLATRLSKAFGDLARSQEKLTDELTRRCEQHAQHFEDICRMLDRGVPEAVTILDFENALAAALHDDDAWRGEARKAA